MNNYCYVRSNGDSYESSESQDCRATKVNMKQTQHLMNNHTSLKFSKTSLISGKERNFDNQQLRHFPKFANHSPTMLHVVSDMATGGKIDYCTNEKGNIYMSVKYGRDLIIHYAYSPFSALPPAEMKHIAENMPEIISDFPVLHGVDSSSSGFT